MAFKDIKEDIDTIQDECKKFVDINLDYIKLWGFKVTMKSMTLVLKFILMLVFFSMFTLFASIALAIVIGRSLDNYVYGFLIVAGIYLILGLIVSTIKHRLIEGSVLRKFSEIFFND